MCAVLVAVRHAMPDASPDVPPEAWTLSEEGRSAARVLVAGLPARALLVSSSERKAWETLAVAGDEVRRDGRLDEVRRPGEPWEGEYLELRRRYVSGDPPVGWESYAEAARRFQDAVDETLAGAHGRPVVLATHGMVLTTWLVSRGVLQRADAVAFWSGLRFPDRVDLPVPRPVQ